MSSELLGYILAVSVAVSGPTGARLNNTGELRELGYRSPVFVIALSVIYGVSTAAAFFYFSWAYLHWVQIVAFFIAWFLLGDPIGRCDSKGLVWLTFIVSVVLAVTAQILLLTGTDLIALLSS